LKTHPNTSVVFKDKEYSPAEFTELPNLPDWAAAVQGVVTFWLGDDAALTVQTSGSTGRPKQIAISKEVLQNSAQTTLAFLDIQTGRALQFLPAHYIGGKMMVIRAMVGGLTLHLLEPKSSLPRLHGQFDLLALTPLQAANSLQQLQHAMHIILGGGEVSLQLEERLQAVPSAIYNSYGMTETASHVALRRINGPERARHFTAMPGVTFAQDDRDCLVIQAPHLWVQNLVTNDVVRLHSESTFTWLGRADNVVNSGGVKLHPEEIERLLAPCIDKPFFVAGIPDARLGQKLALVVESETPLTVDFRFLPRLQQPREIHVIKPFVYTETGKVNRIATLKRIV
jgi:O-succinylbenzoic acid--CoA ligase